MSRLESDKQRRILILGLPNTGKSQLFIELTGVYSLTANYQYTTIEEKRVFRRINRENFEIIDTPGLHCLYIHSEEELVVRNLLYDSPPDIIIQVINAAQLKQSLTLTADLLDLGIPMVVCLNMMDDAQKNGLRISSEALEEKLGVPVVKTIASVGSGIRELQNSLNKARPGKERGRYGKETEKSIIRLAPSLRETVPYPWKTAALLLLGDPFMHAYVMGKTPEENRPGLERQISDERAKLEDVITRDFLFQRNTWVDEVAGSAIQHDPQPENTYVERFADMSRHPVYGIPILLFFLALMFFMVVYVADWIEELFLFLLGNPITEWVGRHLPAGFWRDLMVGHYGLLTLGLFNALGTVLPILGTFFLFLSLLEDIGYITNLCVLTQRLFNKLGLSGKSILSLILGFACRTVATLSTRGLTSYKEKFIANFLIAFTIPCGAKLALLIGVLGQVGFVGFAFTTAVLLLCFMGVGLLLNKVLKNDAPIDFIQVLPPARLPDFRGLFIKTGYRVVWFLKESIPIFVMAAAAMFALDRTGVLNALKWVFAPVAVQGLGLPLDIVDVLLLCLARSEVAAGLLLKMAEAHQLSTEQVIVSVILITTFIPCLAHVGALRREMGNKTTFLMISSIMLTALALSILTHHLLAPFLGGG